MISFYIAPDGEKGDLIMRVRTTWHETEIAKRASAMKTADPYTMNQDHVSQQPGHDDYVIGDSSTFAEDVDTTDRWKAEMSGGQVKRNEIGMPEFRPETFNHPDKTAALNEAVLIKKADMATSVARLMLGSVSEQRIEDQALSLMWMPDASLIETHARLANKDEDQDEGQQQSKQAQDQDQDQGQGQQQSKQAQDQQEQQAQDEQSKQASAAAFKAMQAGDMGAFQAAFQSMVQAAVAPKRAPVSAAAKKLAEAQQQVAQQCQQLAEQTQQIAQQAGQGPQGMQAQQMAQQAQQLAQQAQQMAQQGQQDQQAQQQDQQAQQQTQQLSQQMQGQQDQQAQQMAQQGQQQVMQGGDDEMLAQMLGQGQQAQEQLAQFDADIQLEAPSMDVGDVSFGEEDAVLQTLFATDESQAQQEQVDQSQGKTAAQHGVRTASTRTVGTKPTAGVSKIGGGVSGNSTGASSEINKLQAMWHTSPDVREAFGMK